MVEVLNCKGNQLSSFNECEWEKLKDCYIFTNFKIFHNPLKTQFDKCLRGIIDISMKYVTERNGKYNVCSCCK